MNNIARTLLFIGALWTGAASADGPADLTEQDWVDAARVSLAKIEREQRLIVVLDDSLSPAARDALKQLRKTISVAELPQREEFELPPGDYLHVRQFEAHGDRFEFRSTLGPVPREGGRNCGENWHFFVERGPDGAWKPGLADVMVC